MDVFEALNHRKMLNRKYCSIIWTILQMGSGAASCDRSSGKTVPVAEAATAVPTFVLKSWTRQVSRVEKWMLDRQSGNELELKNMEAEYESKKRHLECTRMRDELELKTMEAACESKKQSLKSRWGVNCLAGTLNFAAGICVAVFLFDANKWVY